jgi:3-oxoacyl-[acyl-carrier protein] reductase
VTTAGGAEAESLRDRVFLVTGSGRGLGAAVARAAARGGARVTLNCRHDLRAAESVAALIEAEGGRAVACRADVTDPVQARHLVDETVRAFGRIDVLVNAVGSFSWKPLADVEPAEWREVFASNLESVYHLCRSALPVMRQQHWGRIVNLGAVGAENTTGEPQRAVYAAAKAGVIALSRSLALEEARYGITVNVVSPGLLEEDGEGRSPAALLDRVPVGHAGCLADVVRAVLFFASPAADFVTGQVLSVAGGARG